MFLSSPPAIITLYWVYGFTRSVFLFIPVGLVRLYPYKQMDFSRSLSLVSTETNQYISQLVINLLTPGAQG